MNLKNLIKPYCEHLEKGFSEKSFVPCDFAQLEEFAQKENLVHKIEMAKRASLKFWESLASNALKENIEFFKQDLWIFVMKCRFGWNDEPKVEVDNEPQIVEVQLKLNNDEGLTDEEKKEYCG
jgi:hypothetical protein